MDRIDSILVRLRAPRGGFVADSMIVDAAREAADEIELLRRRLADCVVWMDSREKIVPGMPRLCDMARDVLKAQSGEPSDG